MVWRWLGLGLLCGGVFGGLLAWAMLPVETRAVRAEVRRPSSVTSDKLRPLVQARLAWELNLVKRIHHRSGEGLPGLTTADLDILISAARFSSELIEQNEFGNDSVTLGRAYVLRALTACLLANWGVSAEVLERGLELLQQAPAEQMDWEVALELAGALNLKACLDSIAGDHEAAIAATSQVQALVTAAVSTSAETQVRQALLWESSLAFRSQAILLAASQKPASDVAARSLSQALQLYGSLDGDRGLYQWDLPHFLVDAWQLLAFLQVHEGNTAAASRTAGSALEAVRALDQDIRRVGAVRGHGMRQSRLNQAQAYLQRLAKITEESVGTQADPFANAERPVMERRLGRTLHPDLLATGRLPGEFEPQAEIGIVWADAFWTQAALGATVDRLAEVVPVRVLVQDAEIREQAKLELARYQLDLSRVTFEMQPTDTVWLRDYGPAVVLDAARKPLIVDFFAGPNGLDFRLQNEYLPGRLASSRRIPWAMARILLEGGQMLSNGDGLLLVSSDVFDRNASAGIPAERVQAVLKRLTGATTIVPFSPLAGEPTGHIDVYATFTDTDSLVIGSYETADHPNRDLLDEMALRVASVVTSQGPLRVTRIPMPPQHANWTGRTYTNVIYANGLLLMPSWSDVSNELEQQALEVYRRLLPEWRVETVTCDELGLRGGALRCISINFPATADRQFAELRTDR